MCTTCGCGHTEALIELRSGDAAARYRAVHNPPTVVPALHGHAAAPASASEMASPGAAASVSSAQLDAVHAPGTPAERIVAIERDLLAANDAIAGANRAAFMRSGILALNVVSSPGAGKTTLLVRTLDALKSRWPLAVIEGDQATTRDAERIRATGVAAVQINTGKGCHLDARMVADALPRLAPADGSMLFVENVGNLVCPAAFDLGEAHKVLVLSVTEGDDKPLKYPDMFRAASLIVVNKIDLLPYVSFDVDAAIAHARRLNPGVAVIRLSATTGDGMEPWLDWLEDALQRARASAVAHGERVEHAA